HDTGVKTVHHPLVGEVTFTYESMELVADPGLTMFVCTAEPGSKSEQALNLLASWTATPDEETANADHEEQPRHSNRTTTRPGRSAPAPRGDEMSIPKTSRPRSCR